MRVAAIDIGTNSVLLTVAERIATRVVPVVERATITRLGRGVDRTRELDSAGVRATLECLASYAATIAESGATRLDVVGTSAMRDAEGGGDFCRRAEEVLGIRPRVISGDEEARLTFLGALLELDATGNVIVADIGGGSTEIIVGSASAPMRVFGSASLDIGSVRLFERHVAADPPAVAELDAVRLDVREALRRAPELAPRATLVGVAGTVTTLLAIERELEAYEPQLVHNQRLSVTALETLTRRLGGIPLAARRRLKGLEPERADVIVVGACILSEVAKWARVGEVLVSDRGVRWGLVRELLAPSD